MYVHHAAAPFIIKNDGKVGIGTTDPSTYTLNVNGQGRFADHLTISNNKSIMTNDYQCNTNWRNMTFTGPQQAAYHIVLMPGTAASNVGIGTASPKQKLHIFQTEGGVGAKHATIRLGGYLDKGAEIAAYRTASNSNNMGLKFSANNVTNGIVDVMTLDDLGNVGIGTASPLAMLHIAKSNSTAYSPTRTNAQTVTDAANGLIIENTNIGTGRFSVLTFEGHPYDAPTYDYAQIGAKWTSDGNSELFFKTEDAGNVREVMRITDTGRVGLGTTNPADDLLVYGSGNLALIQGSSVNVWLQMQGSTTCSSAPRSNR